MVENNLERYLKNTNAFSLSEVALLQAKKVCIVGCGGLGGHVAEALARFGVRQLTLVDGDVFSLSNLNRQRFSTEQNIGKNKAEAAKAQIAAFNSDVHVFAIPEMLDEQNAEKMFKGHDLVMDCLDNMKARRILDRACGQSGIPYIHGAIAGFYGQVATVLPGDDSFLRIYTESSTYKGLENELGNPPFMPQLVAAIQCSEAFKLLCGRGELLRNKLLFIDLCYNSFEEVCFTN